MMNEPTAFEKFQEAIGDHVPPEAKSAVEEITVRVPARYRVRVRGSDAQYEAVCRFTGFSIPEDPVNAGELLILNFVSEHSFADPADYDEEGPDAKGA